LRHPPFLESKAQVLLPSVWPFSYPCLPSPFLFFFCSLSHTFFSSSPPGSLREIVHISWSAVVERNCCILVTMTPPPLSLHFSFYVPPFGLKLVILLVHSHCPSFSECLRYLRNFQSFLLLCPICWRSIFEDVVLVFLFLTLRLHASCGSCFFFRS